MGVHISGQFKAFLLTLHIDDKKHVIFTIKQEFKLSWMLLILHMSELDFEYIEIL